MARMDVLYVRRIGALFAALLEEREHGCQKLFLRMACDQAGAKFTQDRGVKAWVREL